MNLSLCAYVVAGHLARVKPRRFTPAQSRVTRGRSRKRCLADPSTIFRDDDVPQIEKRVLGPDN